LNCQCSSVARAQCTSAVARGTLRPTANSQRPTANGQRPTANERYAAFVAGGTMLLYLSLGSRLAPLLLMLSAILAGMRWLHDQPALAARHLNGVAAALYVVAGLVVAVPFAVRTGLMRGSR